MATRRAKGQPNGKKKRAIPRLATLPFLWKHETGAQAVGLSVAEQVWAANDSGDVVALSIENGKPERSVKLPAPVYCLLVDAHWAFAGCHDGNIYDVSGAAPRLVHVMGPQMGINALAVHGATGRLVIADNEGGLTAFDVEGNRLWERRGDDDGEGWLCCADDDGVYHGCADGVRAYDWSGALTWSLPKLDDVRSGVMRGGELLVTCGWEKRKQTALCAVTKRGKLRVRVDLKNGAPDWQHNGAESCCADDTRLFASCGGYLFCFDRQGKPLWDALTGCDSACSMQTAGGRLFMVTTTGTVACLDLTAPCTR